LDNITHTLTGALLGQMGLKRRSRFAMAACLIGANAPDIDVFAPAFLPVDGIAFHRGPFHSVFAIPLLAAAIVGLLWLVDRLFPPADGKPRLRPGALFAVALLAVLTHPFLDWLTTYAIAIFAPLSWRWYSVDAIFIIDWVYWLLMTVGIVWSSWRWRRGSPHPGRPAQIIGIVLLAYIALNVTESAWAERATAAALRKRGVEPTLVVASPPPLAFWQRSMAWRSADRFGTGRFDPRYGLQLDGRSYPIGLNDPRLVTAAKHERYIRSFLSWSRMPIVIVVDGKTYLSDQRYYGPIRSAGVPASIRNFARRHSFLVPLDSRPSGP
jgi:inner membrane protein